MMETPEKIKETFRCIFSKQTFVCGNPIIVENAAVSIYNEASFIFPDGSVL